MTFKNTCALAQAVSTTNNERNFGVTKPTNTQGIHCLNVSGSTLPCRPDPWTAQIDRGRPPKASIESFPVFTWTVLGLTHYFVFHEHVDIASEQRLRFFF